MIRVSRMTTAIVIGLLAVDVCPFVARAEEKRVRAFQPPAIEVPPGFVVEVAAGPSLVTYPMMAAFDERGRLFIAESDGQNLGKEELLRQEPRFVRMLEDRDGDGRFDKSTIFADRMVMPEGALWHDGALYIVSAPWLWRLDDTNGDGVADRREKLVGQMDLIGNANQHGPYLAPDGRLLFSGGTFGYDLVGSDGKSGGKGNWAGVFSCRADGADVRVECHAGINPVEVAFTPEGEMLGTCAIFDRVGGRCDALVHWVHGASYAEPLRAPVLKPTGRYLPAALRWGQVAPSGLVRYRGAQFGDEYRDSYFACHFNTHELVRIRLTRVGATFRGEDETFLRSTSIDFHPADVLEDADGSLLLIDTGAWLTMGCPSSKIGKPETFGAIYRIRRADARTPDDPRGLKLDWSASPAELVARLDDARPFVRDRAIAALARQKEAVAPLRVAVRSSQSARARRNAVWALARLGTDEARTVLCEALDDSEPGVRQPAARAAGTLRERGAVERLMKRVESDELPVRREAATALGLIGDARAVPALFTSLRTARDEFLEHALIAALVEIGDPAATRTGLADPAPAVQRGALLALDQMAGGGLTRDETAPLLATTDAELRRTVLEVIAKRPGWGDELVGVLASSLAVASPTSEHLGLIAGAVTAFAGNAKVQSLVAEALDSAKTPPATRSVLLESIGRSELTKLPAPWIAPFGRLIEHSDAGVQRQALASLARFDVEPLEKALRSAAGHAERDAEVRLAALALVAGRGGPLDDREFAFLMEQVGPEIAPVEKLSAANALALAGLTASQLTALVPVVERAGSLEAPALLRAFENAARSKRVEGQAAEALGLSLVDALANSRGRTAVPRPRLEAALAPFPPTVIHRFDERIPKTAAADKVQETRVAELEAAAAHGEPARGRQVFFSNRAACSACHRVGGQGGVVGPDLTQVGKVRSARALAESILFPSATLANGFESHTLTTRSGQVLAGLIRRESAEFLHLQTVDGQEVRVPRSEIEDLAPSTVSIMPQGLEQQLTAKQLADLVAFLQTLRE